jgi:hypothetical protein
LLSSLLTRLIDCSLRPLATNYSQSLDKHTRLSLGLVDVSKREFFRNFYTAFDKTFTEANIRSGWHKTGINPFDLEQVLKIFRKDEEGLQASTPSTNHSNGCLDSPSAMRNIRRIVNEEVAYRDVQYQRTIEKLGGACLTLSIELSLARDREQGYIEAIDNQKRKKKRGRPFTEDLRAEEGLRVLFFNPSKLTRARELQTTKETSRDEEALDRLLQAQVRAEKKAQKEAEVQQRREDRAIMHRAKTAKEALKKAQKQQQKEGRDAQRQLETVSKASSSWPRKRQKTQKEHEESVVVVVEPESEMTLN